jgi:acetyl-CoA C-acetyltransferase
MPVQLYPMFESALRAAAGRTVDDHNRWVAELWARFSEVAAGNPHAWIQQAFTAAEIGVPTPDNRMIGFPYTKRMNSNNAVEQSAAIVVCSVERAEALGVPRDRWVFPWAGTDARDTPFVSNRADLHSSPAIRTAGRAVLDLAGIGVDDLAHLDLYSCFPSAVEIAAAELGLGTDRPLTVTGGLAFAGGPWNNYVTHSIAAMTERLRDDAGAMGLVTANGGFVTKHAFGVYSTTPPPDGFRWASPQEEIDRFPSREVCEEWDGPVTVEACTVMYSRGGEPETGLLAVLLADGRRAWGTTTDADALKRMVTEECIGQSAHLAADGTIEF